MSRPTVRHALGVGCLLYLGALAAELLLPAARCLSGRDACAPTVAEPRAAAMREP